MPGFDSTALANARAKCHGFLKSTQAGADEFRLTNRAEPTAYARCFAVFGFHLLQDRETLSHGAGSWSRAIRADLDDLRQKRRDSGVDLATDKTYLQLLSFSLSSLAILNRLEADPLSDHVVPLLSKDIESDLRKARALEGVAGSGNQAMFMAILLIHARDFLGIDDRGQIERWQSLFLSRMNPFGFWGAGNSISHLQFQNGYHIYEILEYLGADVPRWPAGADYVATLADVESHFAPYPGGSGCYDYDAVFLITGAGDASVQRHRDLLIRTATAILREQNSDGGFYESHCVRPRSVKTLTGIVRHVRSARGLARIERSRYGLSLLRPRHDRIHTQWSTYSREWTESDLWDSWFRMLTLARVEVALEPERASQWGFIDYPGIGYHPSLRALSRGL